MFQRFYRACDPVTLERFWWLVSGQLYQAIGLVVYGKTTRLYALSIWMAFVSSIFTLAYRAVDSYVYLIPVIIAFAIWAGLGISGLAHVYIARYSRLAVIVGLLLTTYYMGKAARNYQYVDASTDTRAEDKVGRRFYRGSRC